MLKKFFKKFKREAIVFSFSAIFSAVFCGLVALFSGIGISEYVQTFIVITVIIACSYKD